MAIEPARLGFSDDGIPFSERYDDVYHAAAGGLLQAQHVFLSGNGLPERWRGKDHFCIVETGFGLGLNFLATWQCWKNDPARCRQLEFVSLEKHPFLAEDLAQLHGALPELTDLAGRLREHWPPLVPGEHRRVFDEEGGPCVTLRLILGDAVDTLPTLKTQDVAADAYYLDGFSPAKNPELWSVPVCRELRRLARPGATLATWSVAVALRRALHDAGFCVERRPGFAGKRHMLSGVLPSSRSGLDHLV